MDRGGGVEPFSESVAPEEGFSDDNLHPKPQNFFLGTAAVARGVNAAVATAASVTVTETLAAVAFSLRLTLEAVVDVTGVESDVVTEGEVTSRERQTSFISFSSNSLHKGTMWSRSSDQTTKTRSSRWIFEFKMRLNKKYSTYNEGTALFFVGFWQVAHRVENLDAGIDINVDGDGIIWTALNKSEKKDEDVVVKDYTVARAEWTAAERTLTATRGLRPRTAASKGAK